MRTPYEVLGVHPSAGDRAIGLAFRRLAKACHPDLNAGDPRAERKFKELSAAQAFLKCPERRAGYDARLKQLSRRGTKSVIFGCAGAAAASFIVTAGVLFYGRWSAGSSTLAVPPTELREPARPARPEAILSPSADIAASDRLNYSQAEYRAENREASPAPPIERRPAASRPKYHPPRRVEVRVWAADRHGRPDLPPRRRAFLVERERRDVEPLSGNGPILAPDAATLPIDASKVRVWAGHPDGHLGASPRYPVREFAREQAGVARSSADGPMFTKRRHRLAFDRRPGGSP